jgi:excisionase family DNA binding protein
MEYLTCEQVAEIVHCSIFHVREAVKGGLLKAYKPGKSYLFVREDVDAWVRASEADAKGAR